MLQVKPHIIVPNLIEQPTWGGSYISKLKTLKNKLSKLKIGQSAKLTKSLAQLGQSYELFASTKLSSKHSTIQSPSIELSNPSSPENSKILTDKETPCHIDSLISKDPAKVLGAKALKVHGKKIQVLIKLTQAKGNSYQLHVKKPTRNWFPKPESWYYFKPGLVTLGLKPNTDLKGYKKICQLVNSKALLISQQIQKKKLSIAKGRSQLKTFITKNNPQQFVNLVQVGANQALDLSPCGIHHSWEENPATHPHGNVLYEVQKNVYDPVSTIRAFDKGKIKDNGTVRDIQIDDYFKHLDTSKKANDPSCRLTTKKVIKHTSIFTVRQIFETKNYQMQEISLNKQVSNQHTETKDSYHHLFARKGNFIFNSEQGSWTITQGFSIFIPAATGKYSLKPHESRHAKILKTYL